MAVRGLGLYRVIDAGDRAAAARRRPGRARRPAPAPPRRAPGRGAVPRRRDRRGGGAGPRRSARPWREDAGAAGGREPARVGPHPRRVVPRRDPGAGRDPDLPVPAQRPASPQRGPGDRRRPRPTCRCWPATTPRCPTSCSASPRARRPRRRRSSSPTTTPTCATSTRSRALDRGAGGAGRRPRRLQRGLGRDPDRAHPGPDLGHARDRDPVRDDAAACRRRRPGRARGS